MLPECPAMFSSVQDWSCHGMTSLKVPGPLLPLVGKVIWTLMATKKWKSHYKENVIISSAVSHSWTAISSHWDFDWDGCPRMTYCWRSHIFFVVRFLFLCSSECSYNFSDLWLRGWGEARGTLKVALLLQQHHFHHHKVLQQHFPEIHCNQLTFSSGLTQIPEFLTSAYSILAIICPLYH